MPLTIAYANAALAYARVNTFLYVALHSADPTPAGRADTEITGGGYSRLGVTWTVPANSAMANTNTLTWVNLPPVTVRYFALWDQATNGTCYFSLALPTPLTFTSGATFVIPINDLAVTMS